MASNYTTNYNLCQWQTSDKVLRTEFNADNAKIDAAIAAVAAQVSGKASSSALSSLSATVSGQAATLTKKGNCILHYTTHTGQYCGLFAVRGPRASQWSRKPGLTPVPAPGPTGFHIMSPFCD